MQTWHLSIHWIYYVLACLAVSVVARLVVCVFRARAYQDGELQLSQNGGAAKKGFWRDFGITFSGFGGDSDDHPKRDYLLALIIGICEAAVYPILIFTGQFLVIGGWLGIKTAGHWGVWAKSPTAWNRFLVGNLIVLALSYLWLRRYIVC